MGLMFWACSDPSVPETLTDTPPCHRDSTAATEASNASLLPLAYLRNQRRLMSDLCLVQLSGGSPSLLCGRGPGSGVAWRMLLPPCERAPA